jgi:electron-transferring-flavoprotein dehydrogenase
MSTRAFIIPADHQPPLPIERLIARGDRPPGVEEVPLDVLFVGAGPAGLAGAIELARLCRSDAEKGGTLADTQIAVLDKAPALGEHCLSGAVVNPRSLRELFPGLGDADFPFRGPVRAERVYVLTRGRALRIPTPRPMRNRGHHVASICELVRWMGERAEEIGVTMLAGYPADALLMDGPRVAGVRTAPAGLNRDGSPGESYQPPADVTAKVTVLSEGPRGSLTQALLASQGIGSANPQIFALGVKELWRTPRPPGAVIHTMGWPLPADAFGGSFLYPMGGDLAAIGLVVGLDYHDAALDVHVLLQQLKTHPLMRAHLEGGEMLEWGAKTIPEGGYWSIPERLHGDGVLIAGDAAGLVDVASLKGIHYAIQSGIYAGRVIYDALKAGDSSALRLAAYDAMVRSSYILSDLHATRNMRLGFKRGFVAGGLTANLAVLTRGAFPRARIATLGDAAEPRRIASIEPFVPDGKLTFGKMDANFRSGNTTRDSVPLHVVAPAAPPREVAEFYAAMCPAGVFEQRDGALIINAPNCIDCKATDVLGPRWTPREAGSGPRYKRM